MVSLTSAFKFHISPPPFGRVSLEFEPRLFGVVGGHVQLSFEGNAGRAPVFVLLPSLRLTSAENRAKPQST